MLTAAPARSRVRAFIALTKPRIIELLLVTTVPTMIVAKRGLPSIALIVATVAGGALAAGGANAINMYLDRDIDALMERTKNRPLVTGVIEPNEAIVFAVAIEAAAFFWLWYFVNLLSAVLALAACLFYVFVYTIWLKRSSSQNVVIGGAAGAVPVLVGWSAITNSVGWESLVLFAIIFFWTPPHTWALAIKYEDDYSAASVPMMPVVEGHRRTVLQMVAYSVVVGVFVIGFTFVGDMGWIYFLTSVLLSLAFIAGAVRLLGIVSANEDPAAHNKASLRYFAFSITHLTVLFGAMAVDQLVVAQFGGWGL